MLEIGICIVVVLINLVLFKKFGFKLAFVFNVLLEFAYLYYNKTLIEIYNSGVNYLILNVLAIIVLELLLTGIWYYMYEKLPNIVYIIFATAMQYYIKFVVTFIIGYICGLNINLDTSFKEQVGYIKSSIDLNIDLVSVGSPSEFVSLDYACSNANETIHKIVSTTDINFECTSYNNALDEKQYVFKLKGINRYNGKEAEIRCNSRGCE